jgi:diphosphomevalonate decarboxylase
MKATAEANTNIALVKYWGKRDKALNLPAVGSLSLTLDGLTTRTEVAFDDGLTSDTLSLNGSDGDAGATRRVSKFLDLIRERSGEKRRASVVSSNNFPTAAGLASSASAFAALAVASTRAAGIELSSRELSILARRGSGSAARSICGGFALMHRGQLADGSDAFAEPVDGAAKMDARLVVAVTAEGAKATLSTDGMEHTAATSPYYGQWITTSEPDLTDALAAISAGDLEALGVVTERSCLTFHASAMAARPAVVYFLGATIDGFHAVQKMRKGGLPAWFTCDAGPHIKALTDGEHAAEVALKLAEVPGVRSTRICVPGRGARLVNSEERVGSRLRETSQCDEEKRK